MLPRVCTQCEFGTLFSSTPGPASYSQGGPGVVPAPYSSSGGGGGGGYAGPLRVEQWGSVDARAMRYVIVAAILSAISYPVGIALTIALGGTLTYAITGLTGYIGLGAGDLIALLVVSGVFTATSFALYGRAFQTLTPKDQGLRTPSVLAWVAIVGGVILLTGDGIQDWSVHDTGLVVPAEITLGIGALIFVVGVLVGIWLGLWRLGSRYGRVLFKVGMVLTIVPFVGGILILVAAWEVRKLASRGGPPSAWPVG